MHRCQENGTELNRRRVVSAAVGCVLVAMGLLLPVTTASAAFTRPFLREITGTSSGPFEDFFSSGGGVAVDKKDNLWVGEGRRPDVKLEEFGPAYEAKPGEEPNRFLKTLALGNEGLTVPGSLAIERSTTGHVYVTGPETYSLELERFLEGTELGGVEAFEDTGALVDRLPGLFRSPHVAVDNSTESFEDPSACGTVPLSVSECFVYVAHEEDEREPFGDGLPAGIAKFNGKGERETFSGLGGSEIVGPSGAIAVDPQGNIYARNLEYAPSGVFVQSFNGHETPGLGEDHSSGEGFGGELTGVAFDPVSGHVLIAVRNQRNEEGAVDEFDAATGRFLEQITETSPGAHLHSAFEMTVDSHGDLYVIDRQEHVISAVVVYGPGRFFASFKPGEATERQPTSAVLHGSINPEGLPLSACYFEYVSEEKFRQEGFADASRAECEPPASAIEANTSFQPVQARLSKLVSGTTYRYRLVATTSGPLGGTGEGEALAFTAPNAPRIDSTSATNLASASAELRAQIDPLGLDASYHFEYDTRPYTGAEAHGVSVPIPDADIGSGGPSGGADASVGQQIGGLAPGTTYHFRVVAKNNLGATTGAVCAGEPHVDCTFTTLPQAAPGLPDNRAYELLTPPDKGSASDMFAHEPEANEFENNDVGLPAQAGDGFLLETEAAFGPFAASLGNTYVFSRAIGGWTFTNLASPLLGLQSVARPLFDPTDFSRMAMNDFVGSTSSAAGSRTMNAVGPAGGPYTILHVNEPRYGLEETPGETTIVGASHDVSHVLLESSDHTIVSSDELQDAGSRALYEWTNGEFKLVNVNAEGSLLNRCGAMLGQDTKLDGGAHNAVSYDGSRVFFTAPDPYAKNGGPGCWNIVTDKNTPQLYMRAGGSTVEVSAPEAGVLEAGKPPVRYPVAYLGAAEDGSKVFFLTRTELTKDDEGIHDMEMYEYDTDTGTLTRISRGETGEAEGNVLAVPAISSGGSAVDFTAFGKLTSSAPTVTGGEVNVYRYDTSTAKTRYVATVLTAEASNRNNTHWFNFTGAEVSPIPEASWYTTPDGRYLLFPTTRELKRAYSTAVGPNGMCSNVPATAGINIGHCEELYRYDSQSPLSEGDPGVADNPLCVSCNPSGAPPVSHARFTRSAVESAAAGTVPGMSDDGAYVFFDTADALVPQDSNSTVDTYEWHEGRISLISSGKDSAPSFFLGLSPYVTPNGKTIEGGNAFFGTHANLVPQDTDAAGDLYDARICEPEDPCIKPPAANTAQCEGDACQSSPPPPLAQTPATLTLASSGNVAAEVMPKLQVTPTNGQKLAKALKACRKKPKRQRKKCVSQAHRRYGKQARKSARPRRAGSRRRAGR